MVCTLRWLGWAAEGAGDLSALSNGHTHVWMRLLLHVMHMKLALLHAPTLLMYVILA